VTAFFLAVMLGTVPGRQKAGMLITLAITDTVPAPGDPSVYTSTTIRVALCLVKISVINQSEMHIINSFVIIRKSSYTSVYQLYKKKVQ
jgi:hypothetical protein